MQTPLLGAPSSRSPGDRPSGRPPRSPPARSGGEAASHARPGALGLRAAPLGSDLQLPKLVASEVSAPPRGGNRRRRRVTGGGARPPTRSSAAQDAPFPRVPDPGLHHPRVPGACCPGVAPSLRVATPTLENPGPQAAPQQRVHGSWPAPYQRVHQSSVLRLCHPAGSLGPGLRHTGGYRVLA